MAPNIDAQPVNQDWTKQTWDLLDIRGKRQLERWLDHNGISTMDFRRLPVYDSAPDWVSKALTELEEEREADRG